MAITNQERVGRASELFKEGLLSFVERGLKGSMPAALVRGA